METAACAHKPALRLLSTVAQPLPAYNEPHYKPSRCFLTVALFLLASRFILLYPAYLKSLHTFMMLSSLCPVDIIRSHTRCGTCVLHFPRTDSNLGEAGQINQREVHDCQRASDTEGTGTEAVSRHACWPYALPLGAASQPTQKTSATGYTSHAEKHRHGTSQIPVHNPNQP